MSLCNMEEWDSTIGIADGDSVLKTHSDSEAKD